MLAIAASEDEVIPELSSDVAIAAINGPRSVVISGEQDAVLAIADRLARRGGHRTKRLRVSHAFHSPLMDSMLAEFRGVAEKLTYSPPDNPIVSNVTGRLVGADQLCTPEYWVRHVRETVRFCEGVRALEAHGVSRFVELGPDGSLSSLGQECLLGDRPSAFIPVLHRDRPEARQVTAAVCGAHAHGAEVSWPAVLRRQRRTAYRPSHLRVPAAAVLERRRVRGPGDAAREPGPPPPRRLAPLDRERRAAADARPRRPHRR